MDYVEAYSRSWALTAGNAAGRGQEVRRDARLLSSRAYGAHFSKDFLTVRQRRAFVSFDAGQPFLETLSSVMVNSRFLSFTYCYNEHSDCFITDLIN